MCEDNHHLSFDEKRCYKNVEHCKPDGYLGDSNFKHCEECENNYKIELPPPIVNNGNGDPIPPEPRCVVDLEVVSPGCLFFNEDEWKCEKCLNSDFYLSCDGNCFAPIHDCLKSDISNHICYKCEESMKFDHESKRCYLPIKNCYIHHIDNDGLLTCDDCDFGYGHATAPGQDCDQIFDCSQFADPDNCGTCMNGYDLHEGLCLIPIEHCITLEYHKCDECEPNYTWSYHDRACVSNCTFDNNNNCVCEGGDRILVNSHCFWKKDYCFNYRVENNMEVCDCPDGFNFIHGFCKPIDPNCTKVDP